MLQALYLYGNMSGGVTGIDALRRVKSNRRLALNKEKYFVAAKEYKHALEKRELNYAHSTSEDLANIRREIKRNRKRYVTKVIVSVLIAGIVVYTVVYFLNQFIKAAGQMV